MGDPRTQIWHPINRPNLGVADAISEAIRNEEWRRPDLLTRVDNGPTLLIVSDYAGDHSNSRYQSLSFLLADLKFIWYWDEVRSDLRRNTLRDGRHLAYKKLSSDEHRARTLVPFLRAANSIPGLLMTFLIDKRIETMFARDPNPSIAPVIDQDHWRGKPFEKLMRVGHLGALLVSGLVGEKQNVLWVSDQDEIVPNHERHIEVAKLFGHILSHYLNCDVGRAQFATTRSDDGSFALEDLAALPDFAAGALAEVVTEMAAAGATAGNNILMPMRRTISQKAQAIAAWLADNSYTLKKLAFVIDHAPPAQFKSKLLTMQLDGPIPEYNCFPDLARRLMGNGRWSRVGWAYSPYPTSLMGGKRGPKHIFQ